MSAYSLSVSYTGLDLVNGFNWYNGSDLSNGFVSYQSREDALAKDLWSVDSSTGAVTLRVDDTNVYAADGSEGKRPSIRIESIQAVERGLIIGDFAHMPGSVCGSWPAFWMYGPDWPDNGELDIIEGANTAQVNLISAHTLEGCTLPASGDFTGTQGSTDCTSPGNNGNIGCNYVPPSTDTSSYGDSFNAIGGGIYAVEWTDDTIKVWHFPRNAIPVDIVLKVPDPSGWGEPEALFGGSTCDVDTFFNDMSIVLTMDLCGDYAGNVWGVTDTCDTSTGSDTCVEWVAGHPEALANVFWEINSIDVYTKPESASSSSAAVSSTSSAAHSTRSGLFANSSTSSGSLSTSAAAASSTPVGLTSAPISGSASLTSTAPTTSGTGVPDRDPLTVGDFVYLGCFGSSSSYPTFNEASTSNSMTVETCVSLCASNRYAGVFDTTCYCADSLDPATSALADQDQCNTPCPGNPAEYCGGLASVSTSQAANATGGASSNSSESSLISRLLRRDAPNSILLTVYGNVAAIQPVPPPAPGLGAGGEDTTTVTATNLITLTTTVTYTTVCATNPASLETRTYATIVVVEDCGCAHQTYPAVAMATVVQACAACGASGESSVTLTVPSGLVAVGAAAVTETGAAGVAAAGATATGAVVVVGGGTAAANASVPVATATGTAGTGVVVAGAPGMGKEIAGVLAAGTFVLGLALLL
ncbi:Mixed-linked glucanase [Pleurostoma richardsiae]|uniref:Mixed-linked glucanase n=1 Tax=Pleurostoma richardsiae TaxID=41990 RepID=A0AA38RK74_9PEZI|nr:Mixed-linked glucanase [Pleurostoma richardsiae]